MTALDTLLDRHPEQFRDRVRTRLANERVAWLTVVADFGVPQPNPVWFLWDGASFVVRNDERSPRPRFLAARPDIALHFDGGPYGRDIVVFRGRAEIVDEPGGLGADYLAKYGPAIDEVFGGADAFARTHPTATLIHPTRVRGR